MHTSSIDLTKHMSDGVAERCDRHCETRGKCETTPAGYPWAWLVAYRLWAANAWMSDANGNTTHTGDLKWRQVISISIFKCMAFGIDLIRIWCNKGAPRQEFWKTWETCWYFSVAFFLGISATYFEIRYIAILLCPILRGKFSKYVCNLI